MDSLKKNPVFAVVTLVCLLLFLAGAFLTFMAAGAVAKSDKKLQSAERSLNAAHLGDPAPSAENVEASAQNLAELIGQLKNIRADLERGTKLELSSDGVVVMASIQQFISEAGAKLEAHQEEDSASGEMEAAPIRTAEDFAFGFDAYADAATIPADPRVVPLLDKQRQILSALMDKLIASHPESIEKIEREALEAVGPAQKIPGTFEIDPGVSARVPDAIETLAFRVSFQGYTESLRLFLNELAAFDLPIVVRSVEVARPAGNDTVDTGQTQKKDKLESIFGAFGMEDAADEEAPAEAQKPVIVDNLSTFTLLLEFIEVVLPSETQTEEGDAA
jgi:hypothetical protein